MGANLRIITASLLFFLLSESISAQQDPLFNKYMFNPLFINPAYAGSRDAISAVLVNRAQWVGFDGAPVTQTLSVHAPLANKKMGLGVSIMRDEIGPSVNYGILGAYAYRIKMGHGKLSFGLRGGVYNYNLNLGEILENMNQDEPYSSPENSNTTFWIPSLDFGLRYHDRVKHAGITISHINKPKPIGNSSPIGFSIIPHVKLMGGYAFEINEHMVFKPSFLVNTSTSLVTMADVNASILFNRVLWAGVSYRTNKALVGMIQYDINDTWSFGYSYDYNLNKLRNYSSGSHEVFIRFEYARKISPIHSPRYF